MTASIRLRVPANGNGDRTLDGYVFTDLSHARDWLRQSFVKPEDYQLEAVEVGETHPCRRCCGTGFIQSAKTIGGRMTVQEFLAEKPTG